VLRLIEQDFVIACEHFFSYEGVLKMDLA